jgi:hypothetical protein
MKKRIGIIRFIIRLFVYFILAGLTTLCESNGIINGLILFPVLILLFEIIFLQIRHKNVNLFVICREMGARKMIKGVLKIAGSLVVFFGLIILTVLIIWHSSTPHHLKRLEYWHQFKKINVENDTGKPVCVIINFRYTEEELTKYSITIDNEYFNRIDTFLLGKPHWYNSHGIHLPINEFDSIPFPKDFKISVLDSTCTSVLRELDFDEFITLTKNEYSIKNGNPLTQAIWWLQIDSIINLEQQKIKSP